MSAAPAQRDDGREIPWEHAEVGISDRESWLLREAYPAGRATGWRRTGCLVMLAIPLVLIVAALVVEVLT